MPTTATAVANSSALPPAIDLQNVRFEYAKDNFALVIAHWSVGAGDQVACVGPSGSGKSTLLSLLAGTLTPQSGSVRVLGTDLHQLSDTQRRRWRLAKVGMVWQEFALLDHLSVVDNALLPVHLDPTISRLAPYRQRAETLLAQLGLDNNILRRSPTQLSQGERQRVAIARALVRQPELILADEPTGNLDPDNKQAIVNLLSGYASEHNVSLVFVTHDHSLLPNFPNVVTIDGLTSSEKTQHETALPGPATQGKGDHA